jgi:hypothetical protein
MWLPFGVDATQFTPPDRDAPRRWDVGFRANAMTQWNDGERERFFAALRRLEPTRPTSLVMSRNGEGFLSGTAYVDWMRSCSLLGNSVSASGTVGPRFLEALSCGTIPIAPRHRYEDLLTAEVHYIPVDAGNGTFPELEARVDRFFTDAAYRAELIEHGRQLVDAHTVDRHARHVLAKLGMGYGPD